MNMPRKIIEINEPSRRRQKASEFRQHLTNASNELYLHELLCIQHGYPVPASLKRAMAASWSLLPCPRPCASSMTNKAQTYPV